MMPPSDLRLCYITDRHALAPRPLLPVIVAAIEAGVDLVQIREKDLPTPELVVLVEAALDAARRVRPGSVPRVVVNDRLDVALGTGAAGVHLGGQSIPAEAARAALAELGRAGMCVGVSCHSASDVKAAERAGADYVLLGPIFETASKAGFGPPLGLEGLAQAARGRRIPLLALGGVTLSRVRACLEAGATGVAGITMFQSSISMAECVAALRGEVDGFLRERGQAAEPPAEGGDGVE